MNEQQAEHYLKEARYINTVVRKAITVEHNDKRALDLFNQVRNHFISVIAKYPELVEEHRQTAEQARQSILAAQGFLLDYAKDKPYLIVEDIDIPELPKPDVTKIVNELSLISGLSVNATQASNEYGILQKNPNLLGMRETREKTENYIAAFNRRAPYLIDLLNSKEIEFIKHNPAHLTILQQAVGAINSLGYNIALILSLPVIVDAKKKATFEGLYKELKRTIEQKPPVAA